MPRMTGYELMVQLRPESFDAPHSVLVVHSRPPAQSIPAIALLKEGAVAFLTKPYRKSRLPTQSKN